jgi:hypothetical protein
MRILADNIRNFWDISVKWVIQKRIVEEKVFIVVLLL